MRDSSTVAIISPVARAMPEGLGPPPSPGGVGGLAGGLIIVEAIGVQYTTCPFPLSSRPALYYTGACAALRRARTPQPSAPSASSSPKDTVVEASGTGLDTDGLVAVTPNTRVELEVLLF